MNIERGTKPYMAPEIILEGKLNYAAMDDWKAIDIWALGMTFFSIINSDVEFPYEVELNLSSEKAPDLASKFEKLLKEMIANKSKPQSSKKYKQRQLKEWGQLDKLYHKCTAFDAFLRPSSEDVQVELNGKVEKVPSVLSEGTSLEEKASNKIVKEHDRDIRLARTESSAVSEHAHNTGHKPLVKFIDRDPYYYTRRVKEAIHIRPHPNNINRDSGIEIPEAWLPTVKKDNNRRAPRQRTAEGENHWVNSKDRNAPIRAVELQLITAEYRAL